LNIVEEIIILESTDPAPLVRAEQTSHVLAPIDLFNLGSALRTPMDLLAFSPVHVQLLVSLIARLPLMELNPALSAKVVLTGRTLDFVREGGEVYNGVTAGSRAEPFGV